MRVTASQTRGLENQMREKEQRNNSNFYHILELENERVRSHRGFGMKIIPSSIIKTY